MKVSSTKQVSWLIPMALFLLTQTYFVQAKEDYPMLEVAGHTYTFNASNPIQWSKVGFQVNSSAGTIRGTTTRVQGRLTGDGSGKLARGQIQIDASTLDTGNAVYNRFTHNDVLETQRHSEIRLEVLDIVSNGTPQGALKGRLTLHGVTRTVEVPCTISARDDGTLVFTTTANLKLTDYGAKPYKVPFVFNMENQVAFLFEFAVLSRPLS